MRALMGPEMVKKVKAIFQWDITTGGKTESWTVDLKNGDGSVYAGKAKKKAGCTLTVAEEDFVRL
jgi:hypothetical protein